MGAPGAVEVCVSEGLDPALGDDELVAGIRCVHGDATPVPLSGSVAAGSAVRFCPVDARLSVAPNAPILETVNVTTKSQLLVTSSDSPTRPSATPTPQVLLLVSTVNLIVPVPVSTAARS